MIRFLLEIRLNDNKFDPKWNFIKKPKFTCHHSTEEYEFIVWGDPILSEEFTKKLELFPNVEFITNNLYGHYYYFLFKKRRHEIILGNSLLSILPLYYNLSGDKLLVSENALILGEYAGISMISKIFILETVLFNFALSDQSILEGIRLLPANTFIKIIDKKINIIKHTNIEDYFSSDPVPRIKSIENVTDTFIETTKKYLPDRHYIHALTGGLDGRTLVSTAMFYKKDFSCYCFGTNDSEDRKIGSRLAEKADIPFIIINLDENYSMNESLNCGLEFIWNSSGAGTFSRSHYLYASKQLVKVANHIISGNFGSEILRAPNVIGVLISPNFYKLFTSKNISEAIKGIDSSAEWNFLNKPAFRMEWEYLQQELEKFTSFNRDYKHLSRNKKFYKTILEEAFRKYYGAEMVNQYYYIYNRTPFLDIDFLKVILKSKLAGVHSDFFTHNPLKRYKGQILHAHIIRKTYPAFGRELLDKGYRPADLLNSFNRFQIAKSYIIKRFKRRSHLHEDPNGVMTSFKNNMHFWNNLDIDQELFDKGRIRIAAGECDFNNSLNIALSHAWIKNKIRR